MVDIILVNSAEIKKLNRRWFGKKCATDVIAFPYGKGSGEVYICVDTARKQALTRGVSLKSELLRLSVHGFMHIAGYDDTDMKSFCKMRQKEWEMLIRLL